jgi:hypothetical protein
MGSSAASRGRRRCKPCAAWIRRPPLFSSGMSVSGVFPAQGIGFPRGRVGTAGALFPPTGMVPIPQDRPPPESNRQATGPESAHARPRLRRINFLRSAAAGRRLLRRRPRYPGTGPAERVPAAYAAGRRRGVVGGSTGLETAHVLSTPGLEITVVEIAPHLLPRQLDREGAQVLRAKVESQGLKFLIGARTAAVTGESEATGIRLEDGRSVNGEWRIPFSAGVVPRRVARHGRRGKSALPRNPARGDPQAAGDGADQLRGSDRGGSRDDRAAVRRREGGDQQEGRRPRQCVKRRDPSERCFELHAPQGTDLIQEGCTTGERTAIGWFGGPKGVCRRETSRASPAICRAVSSPQDWPGSPRWFRPTRCGSSIMLFQVLDFRTPRCKLFRSRAQCTGKRRPSPYPRDRNSYYMHER